MVDYTIAAIPTRYRGRLYRSRLEARWAAFFDLLGWEHEYEPYDLGRWSPDFLLSKWDVLVEVKPLDMLDQTVWDKAVDVCRSRNLLTETDERGELGGIFLTRVAPCFWKHDIVQLGWFGCRTTDYQPVEACVGWISSPKAPVFTANILSAEPGGWFSISGDAAVWTDRRRPAPESYGKHTMELWARASNTVQWRGQDAQS